MQRKALRLSGYMATFTIGLILGVIVFQAIAEHPGDESEHRDMMGNLQEINRSLSNMSDDIARSVSRELGPDLDEISQTATGLERQLSELSEVQIRELRNKLDQMTTLVEDFDHRIQSIIRQNFDAIAGDLEGQVEGYVQDLSSEHFQLRNELDQQDEDIKDIRSSLTEIKEEMGIEEEK